MKSIYVLMAGCVVASCRVSEPPRTGSPTLASCGRLFTLRSLEPFVAPLTGASMAQEDVADHRDARIQLSLVSYAAERFCVEVGRYPNSVQEIISYGRRLPSDAGCAIRYRMPRHPWTQRYRYDLNHGSPQIVSPGPDDRYGTSDDVSLDPQAPEVVQISVVPCRL